MPSPNAAVIAQKLPSTNVGNATSESQFLDSAGVNPLKCIIPGSNTGKNRCFSVRVAGRITGGTSGNTTIALYYGTSSTIASNTKVATSGAISNGGVATNFMMVFEGFWDSTSQKIHGIFYGFVHGTVVSVTIHSNEATSVDLSTEGLGFTVTALFGSSNAGNIAIVDEFELEEY